MSFDILNEHWNKPSISSQYETLTERLKFVVQEIETLRESCPHTNIEATPGSDVGNWDRGDDCYWVDWKCLDCCGSGRTYTYNPLYKELLKHV